MSLTSDYLVKPGRKARLSRWKSDDDAGLDEDKSLKKFDVLRNRLIDLQQLLYADGRRSLLIVLQAMDTGGKDSTIRHVFHGVNPQGVKVTQFKAPNETELAHDFLWRVHENAPRKGIIRVFNRSHYEDVLIVRVKNLVPRKVWEKRYRHINEFEKLLTDEGTTVVKFYLHVSKHYQKKRLKMRLDDPTKHWKFDPGDLAERKRWPAYMNAYEDAFTRCSTDHAPWYVIPAEHRWFRNLLVAQVLVDALEAMKLRYPPVKFDPRRIKIPD